MRLSVLLAATALAGCAVGPDFVRPDAPEATGYTREPAILMTASAKTTGGEAQTFHPDMDIPGEWWTLFRSPELNSLIEASLRQNQDLKAAQAALRQAYENVYAQQGGYYPQATGSFDYSRNKTATGCLSPASASGNPYYTLWNPQLAVTFTPDVFGLNFRTVESDRALAEQQRYQLEATYLTLTSNVVAAAIQEASLRAQIKATQEIIALQVNLLGILRKQFELGQVAMADQVAQEAALAQSQQALPPLQKQLAVQRDLLTALAGRFPDLLTLLAAIEDQGARAAALAERALLAALDGSCRTPIAGYAKLLRDDVMQLTGLAARADGTCLLKRSMKARIADAEALGRELGRSIRADSPPDIFA